MRKRMIAGLAAVCCFMWTNATAVEQSKVKSNMSEKELVFESNEMKEVLVTCAAPLKNAIGVEWEAHHVDSPALNTLTLVKSLKNTEGDQWLLGLHNRSPNAHTYIVSTRAICTAGKGD